MTPAEVWALARQATGNPDDPDWSEALCAQSYPDAWFPEQGDNSRYVRRVCRRCPLQADCLAYALARDERFGVWGGVTEHDRRRARRWARSGVAAGA